jgi:ribosome-associated protein
LYRDQGRNLENARNKLRDLLLSCQDPTKLRRPSKPSRRSKLRRLEGKRREGDKKRLRKPPEGT